MKKFQSFFPFIPSIPQFVSFTGNRHYRVRIVPYGNADKVGVNYRISSEEQRKKALVR